MGSSELYLLQGGNIAVAAVALMCFLFFLGIGGAAANKTFNDIMKGYGYHYDAPAANDAEFAESIRTLIDSSNETSKALIAI